MVFGALIGGLALFGSPAQAETPTAPSLTPPTLRAAIKHVRTPDDAVLHVVTATEAFVSDVVNAVVPMVRTIVGREGSDVSPVLPAVNVAYDGHGAVACLVAHF